MTLHKILNSNVGSFCGLVLLPWLMMITQILRLHVPDTAPFAFIAFGLTTLGILAGLCSIAIAGIGFLTAGFKRLRNLSSTYLTLGLLGFVSFASSIYAHKVIWRQQMANVADRSQPLIKAIQRYQTEHGKPPADLAALVPEHIARIPATGLASSPEFHYAPMSTIEPKVWELSVPTSTGLLNWDQLIYLPSQNYLETLYISWEPIGDWAYVHE